MTSIVTEADVEKMQKKMAKQHAHELRTLEQKKKKQAKAIKDKAKRMELYKTFSVQEEEIKARHVAEMTELLSGASIAVPGGEKEIAEHDEVVATNVSTESEEEAKIRKKKEKAARKRQAKVDKEKAENEKLEAERGTQVDYRALEKDFVRVNYSI